MASIQQQRRGNTSYIDGGFGTEKGSDSMFITLEDGYYTGLEGPDKVALICDHQSWGYLENLVGLVPQAGCLTLTYRQMMRAARDLALVGGTLVFPSALFDAPKTLSSVELHNCTNLVCTPSNLEELIKDPSRSTRKLDSLESLVVHGGVVSANLLYRGKEALQSGWATSSLTMAEGLGVFGWFSSCTRPYVGLSGYSDSIGTVLEGSLAKICHVDNRDNIVSRGQEGLLHIGGETVIEKYIGDVEGERFYQDSEGKRWFITNYLATMDPEGLVRLTSEFKTYKPEADGADVSP
ncbi:unnamed protein product [Aureobasidium pullulans]|nr:unnamed protein product [Aureobasidium pullulans]